MPIESNLIQKKKTITLLALCQIVKCLKAFLASPCNLYVPQLSDKGNGDTPSKHAPDQQLDPVGQAAAYCVTMITHHCFKDHHLVCHYGLYFCAVLHFVQIEMAES